MGFSVRHMMVSNVRGRFTDFEAVVMAAENPLDSTVQAAIRVASIVTGNDTRDADLRPGGFLSVEDYPEMRFTSTAMRMDGDVYLVDGDMTIRANTKPLTLRAEFGGISPDPYEFTRAGFPGLRQSGVDGHDVRFELQGGYGQADARHDGGRRKRTGTTFGIMRFSTPNDQRRPCLPPHHCRSTLPWTT
ncbi:YceI family protein [Nonomuraea insulae]|uniref:YceI family protein n=1 Tax=Nonomuraea insulae TaxID=1616787 RepID=A0ABW1D1M6_9ACTN